MPFKRPIYWKEKEIKEIKISKCSFCTNDSVGKHGSFYFCADNKSTTKLWEKVK